MGIPYTGGFYTADGLAGEAVGGMVDPKLMQPGDLTFFRDTCRGYVPGTITHVGFCVSSSGMIADCGGGPTTHVRNHNTVFPGLLIEVRRPVCLAKKPADRSSIKLEGGHLEVKASVSGGLHLFLNQKEIKPITVDIEVVRNLPG